MRSHKEKTLCAMRLNLAQLWKDHPDMRVDVVMSVDAMYEAYLRSPDESAFHDDRKEVHPSRVW